MFNRSSHMFVVALLACSVATGTRTHAQQTDAIRGRIVSDEGKSVGEVRVTATSIPNNVTRSVIADRNGRFTITFANGDGDYWIAMTKLGFAPKRFELKRVADEIILVADAKMDRNAEVLDAMRIRADRARAARNASASDVLGTEKSITNAGIDPSQSGSLAALAASTPGVQIIPGADGNPDQFSVFGLGGDQNRSTLNGVAFSGADVPRESATRASLGVTPWDVSRGGFSGAQLSVRTQSGSNLSSRAISSLLNTPQAEWTDRSGRALGAEYSSVSLGAATAGPVRLDKSFYSAGYQYDRRSSGLPRLNNAGSDALRLAGLADDSASRFRTILGDAGVPMFVSGMPASRTTERGLFLAAFDFAPPTSNTGQALNITATGSFNRMNAPFAQVTGVGTNDAQTTNTFGAIQARHTNYVLGGILSETMVAIAQQRLNTEPYLKMPGGMVRVASALDDGTSGITGLSFGGSRVQETSNVSTTANAENQLSWFSLDNRHSIKFTSSLRFENITRDLTANSLGTFAFNSLADLDANTPVSFSRQLTPRRQSAQQLVGGVSLGDTYRIRPDLQFQYGVRVDGNQFLKSPERNSLLTRELGVSNTQLPENIYFSPRLGFSWSYGEAPQVAIGNGFVRGPRAVLRGGVGVFQNLPSAEIASGALLNTGRVDAVQQLLCVGAAAPRPNWSGYARGVAAIPDRCTDGTDGASLTSSVPEVSLFDRSFRAQQSIRGNVNWSGVLPGGRLSAVADVTYSLNRNQSGIYDRNFAGASKFFLAGEGDRPVFVPATSIVGTSGAIAAQDARVSPKFSRVTETRVGFDGSNAQLTFGVRPVVFSSRYSWSLAYVYSNTRDDVSGFVSTDADPRMSGRARSSLDSRHQITYGVSYNFFDWVPISLSGAVRSGRPFTPMVSTDINGDSYANDRAFVFGNNASDVAARTAIKSLIESGSPAARACLSQQVNQIAQRNSCQGPWASTSNLTIGFNPIKFRLPQRLNVSLYVNNAFGAADLLLHGENKLKGWGQAPLPDQTLLFVRGFDAPNRQFRYDVNPRFGATSQSQTLTRNPVVVTAQFRLDVGYARERQLLTQSLDKGRTRPGVLPTDAELRSMGGTLIPPNPITLILQQTDSLKLTREQADSLATINREYSLSFEDIWMPVATKLAALPANYDRGQAYQDYRKARESTIDVLMKLAPMVRSMLSKSQLRQLPTQALTSLDTRYLASVRSSTTGGASMGALAMLAQMGWAGGTVDASATAVMLHR